MTGFVISNVGMILVVILACLRRLADRLRYLACAVIRLDGASITLRALFVI